MTAPGVVVIGAGPAGFYVATELRQLSETYPIKLIGDEPHPPYQRPPLSKRVLASEDENEEVQLRPAEFYAANGIELLTGNGAIAVDRHAQNVVLASGLDLPYEQLVFATGSRPRIPPIIGVELDGVLTLRTHADSLALRRRMRGSQNLLIIGGGVIGMEVAGVARRRGLSVTVVEAFDRPMARMVSRTVSTYLHNLHRQAGTDVHCGTSVSELVADQAGRVKAAVLSDGSEVAADIVLVAVGVVPRDQLAVDAGLPTNDGILVDVNLRTPDEHVWAVGDCARFEFRPGSHRRLESVQNATDHGRCVAAALANRGAAYEAVPWFWSEQLDSRVQIAGVADPGDQEILTAEPNAEGFSVLRIAAGRLTAVESVNSPRDHVAARKLVGHAYKVALDASWNRGADLSMLADQIAA
jgi:3-phenylpropionate/trans-cinnamate dioxygenase ferredoxin reductase subunit